ncbi:MAG: hypothetical protein JJ866_19150 [Roseibium sp.]|uniref:hypothetical protein n=1 Tax=Roseibium sp. TaxID=1936156 RepID=UPI001AFF6475|nr:hypothetical protein [Roseibium sp.]MBO6894066.1 hypothetical protein [Roseibium sp.]MBO6929730.1 hypothetical protein [Roseibium sp.]
MKTSALPADGPIVIRKATVKDIHDGRGFRVAGTDGDKFELRVETTGIDHAGRLDPLLLQVMGQDGPFGREGVNPAEPQHLQLAK